MSACYKCRFRAEFGDFCKKGILMNTLIFCTEHEEVPKIHGNHADMIFADTITLDKTNPFYLVSIPSIKNIIFNPPATIIMWGDGTKTVVKCSDGETYDYEVGLAMCLCKRMLGKKYRHWFKDALKKGGMGWWK